MEFTAPYTPQQNGIVERRIVITRNKAHAAMITADLTEDSQGRLWPEAVQDATLKTNILINNVNETPPDTMWYGEPSKAYKFIKPFASIGYVTIRDRKVKKLEEKAQKMLYMGLADNHARDTYRMYNP